MFKKNFRKKKTIFSIGCILLMFQSTFLFSITTKDVVSFQEIFSIESSNQTIQTYFKVNIKDGWSLYSIEKTKIDGPVHTQFSSQTLNIIKVVESHPYQKRDKNFSLDVKYHKKQAFFFIQLKPKNDIIPKENFIKVRFMVCSNKVCLPPSTMSLKIHSKAKVLKSSDLIFWNAKQFEVNEYTVLENKEKKFSIFKNYTSAKKKVLSTSIEAYILPNWKLYSVKRNPIHENEIYNTKLSFQDKSLRLISLTESKPQSYYDKDLQTKVFYFKDKAIFYLVGQFTKKEKSNYKVKIKYMLCDDSMCLPPSQSIVSIKKRNK